MIIPDLVALITYKWAMEWGALEQSFAIETEETRKLDGTIMKIDFAASAAGYGVKTYHVTSLEQLQEALIDAKKQTVSTLIDIKVLPKQ